MRVTFCALAALAFGFVPAFAQTRSPLTDSTDVRIPASGVEYENAVAVSPLDPQVLLVSNIEALGASN